jgi:hypothetical protein
LASFLSILNSLLVGVILVVVPWTRLWDDNYLIQSHPTLRALVLSVFVRGAVTGLGVVNLLLGVSELRERFRDHRG